MSHAASVFLFVMLDIVVLAGAIALVVFIVRKYREQRSLERACNRPAHNMEVFRSKDIYKEIKNDELTAVYDPDDNRSADKIIEDPSEKDDGNNLMRERLRNSQEHSDMSESSPEEHADVTCYTNI
jgi:hypothetical protein